MKPTAKPAADASANPVHKHRLQLAARLIATGMLTVLLASCSILGSGPREDPTIYTLDPQVVTDPTWPSVDWQLSMSGANASASIDNLRITVRPSPNEVQVYKGASWSKTPSNMVEDALLRVLDDSGKILAIARRGTGINAEYKLVLELRRFDSDYAAGAIPAATVELNAKLLHAPDQRVVASRTFMQAQPAASAQIGDVVTAFEHSLETVIGELAGWMLVTGDQHQREAHQ